jgi:hypothetical protein
LGWKEYINNLLQSYRTIHREGKEIRFWRGRGLKYLPGCLALEIKLLKPYPIKFLPWREETSIKDQGGGAKGAME